MEEVRLAVDKGYRILEIYNKETGEGGHFVGCVNTFFKL